MPACKILMPLPLQDFDPTEAAVSWQIVTTAGHTVEFATPDGRRGHADPIMISGTGLDPWGWLPGLDRIRLVGLFMRADRYGRAAYRAMEKDTGFLKPKRYADLRVENYDALILPGGHAQGMKPYLENKTLQAFVADFFETGKPVAAVCHGVVLAARSISRTTGKSVLHGRKTTSLPWKFEKSAWDLSKFFARYWDSGYYRTYQEGPGDPPGYWGVEQEVTRALADPADFLNVPAEAPHHFLKASGMARDRIDDDRPAWVVRDGNYLSARWPGDVHTFARRFLDMLAERQS